MNKVKWVSVLLAALLIAGLSVAGCTVAVLPGKMGGTEGAKGGGTEDGGGGPVLPPSPSSYTLVSIPAGTVTANIGDSGGPFITAGSSSVTVPAFKMGETK